MLGLELVQLGMDLVQFVSPSMRKGFGLHSLQTLVWWDATTVAASILKDTYKVHPQICTFVESPWVTLQHSCRSPQRGLCRCIQWGQGDWEDQGDQGDPCHGMSI